MSEKNDKNTAVETEQLVDAVKAVEEAQKASESMSREEFLETVKRLKTPEKGPLVKEAHRLLRDRLYDIPIIQRAVDATKDHNHQLIAPFLQWVCHTFATENGASLRNLSNVLDYICSDAIQRDVKQNLQNLNRETGWKDIVKLSNAWHAKLKKKKSKSGYKTHNVVFRVGNYEVVEVPGTDLRAEGSKMGHCVGSYRPSAQQHFYSLRDASNNPHLTMYLHGPKLDPDAEVQPRRRMMQMQGRSGRPPVDKYRRMAQEFYRHFNVKFDNFNQLLTFLATENQLMNGIGADFRWSRERGFLEAEVDISETENTQRDISGNTQRGSLLDFVDAETIHMSDQTNIRLGAYRKAFLEVDDAEKMHALLDQSTAESFGGFGELDRYAQEFSYYMGNYWDEKPENFDTEEMGANAYSQGGARTKLVAAAYCNPHLFELEGVAARLLRMSGKYNMLAANPNIVDHPEYLRAVLKMGIRRPLMKWDISLIHHITNSESFSKDEELLRLAHEYLQQGRLVRRSYGGMTEEEKALKSARDLLISQLTLKSGSAETLLVSWLEDSVARKAMPTNSKEWTQLPWTKYLDSNWDQDKIEVANRNPHYRRGCYVPQFIYRYEFVVCPDSFWKTFQMDEGLKALQSLKSTKIRKLIATNVKLTEKIADVLLENKSLHEFLAVNPSLEKDLPPAVSKRIIDTLKGRKAIRVREALENRGEVLTQYNAKMAKIKEDQLASEVNKQQPRGLLRTIDRLLKKPTA